MINITSSIKIPCCSSYQFFFLHLEILGSHSNGQNDGILCVIDFQINSNSVSPFDMTLIVLFMCCIIIFHLWLLLFHFDTDGSMVHGSFYVVHCSCNFFPRIWSFFLAFYALSLYGKRWQMFIAYCYSCWIFWNIYCIQCTVYRDMRASLCWFRAPDPTLSSINA